MKSARFATSLAGSFAALVWGTSTLQVAAQSDTSKEPHEAGAIVMKASPAPPSIEQFMKIRAPGSPTLGPDGTLYVRDWPDGVNQLYKRPAGASKDAAMVRMTNFPDGMSGYSLSPDASKIIASAAVGGNEQDQLYLVDPKTNEVKPLLQDPAVVYSLQLWLNDSSGILYTA